MPQCKCIDCGYLANRDKDTRELVEVERGENGDIVRPYRHKDGPHITTSGPRYDAPVCFINAFDLQSEYKTEHIATEKGDAFKERLNQKIDEVVNQQRECKDFTKWRQGFTPKEHKEMLDREWMIKHQEEREDADKKWRRNQDWKLVIVAGIFTILGSVLAWLLTR